MIRCSLIWCTEYRIPNRYRIDSMCRADFRYNFPPTSRYKYLDCTKEQRRTNLGRLMSISVHVPLCMTAIWLCCVLDLRFVRIGIRYWRKPLIVWINTSSPHPSHSLTQYEGRKKIIEICDNRQISHVGWGWEGGKEEEKEGGKEGGWRKQLS